jgi:hypothetical protein
MEKDVTHKSNEKKAEVILLISGRSRLQKKEYYQG